MEGMNIYFSGIGGVGLGPLAELAHDADTMCLARIATLDSRHKSSSSVAFPSHKTKQANTWPIATSKPPSIGLSILQLCRPITPSSS